MFKAPTNLSRRHKLLLASLATVMLSLGTAGVVSASASSPPASEEVSGVDCENGIDTATGAECDGGPAANPQGGADDGTEQGTESAAAAQSAVVTNASRIAVRPAKIVAKQQVAPVTAQGSQTAGAAESESTGPDEVGGVDCENGIDTATGAECDGGPAANPQGGADDGSEQGGETTG